MGDLISKKAVYDMLNGIGGCDAADEWANGWDKAIDTAIDELEEIPTAYDVDKVVEQLAKRFDYCHEMAEKNDKAKLEEMAFSWRQVANGVMDAIDIVKGAVKE